MDERANERPLVLVVDDLEDLRATLAAILKFSGFRVEVAENGYEGIEKAGRLSPAVILLDLSMPGIDGFETARRLRADDQTRAIPIIAVTAYDLETHRQKAKEAGFDSFLAKPVTPQKLYSEIWKFVAAS